MVHHRKTWTLTIFSIEHLNPWQPGLIMDEVMDVVKRASDTRWVDEHLLEEVERRVRADPERAKRRKCLAEHPLGTIKRRLDQGSFLMRGPQNVGAETPARKLPLDSAAHRWAAVPVSPQSGMRRWVVFTAIAWSRSASMTMATR